MLLKIWKIFSCRNFSSSTVWKNENKSKPIESSSNIDMTITKAPNQWEKKLLVFSGKYKTMEEIPARVSFETISKAKSQMRIKVGSFLMVISLVACFAVVYMGKQKAKKVYESTVKH